MPRHVEGEKLDPTVWNLSTFHAYVSYHVKVHVSFILHYIETLCVIISLKRFGFVSQCSEGFMHTRMRRRVESMIQVDHRNRFVSCIFSSST